MGASLQVLCIFPSDVTLGSCEGDCKLCHDNVAALRKSRLDKLFETNLLGLGWTINQTVVLLVYVVTWAVSLGL